MIGPNTICKCSVCGGRAPLPPEHGKPWRVHHEESPSEAFGPQEAILAPPAPSEAKETPKERLGDISAQVEWIRNRTDISPGMRAMQIKNLLRRTSEKTN